MKAQIKKSPGGEEFENGQEKGSLAQTGDPMEERVTVSELDHGPDNDSELSRSKSADLNLQTIWPWYKLGPDLIGGLTANEQEDEREDNETANMRTTK